MHTATEIALYLPKTRPPRFSPKTMPRPRLTQYVKSVEDARLTIVSAPSGFGKTTIGTGWARELKNRSAIVSWLTLDNEDNDYSLFLSHLAFAINQSLNEQSLDSSSA